MLTEALEIDSINGRRAHHRNKCLGQKRSFRMILRDLWARLSVRILLFGVLFIGGRVGLFLFLQSVFPGLVQNRTATTILTYGWFVLMLLMIYPFFVQPLRQGLRSSSPHDKTLHHSDPNASILARIFNK
jgi:hypothetical protein